MKVRELKDMLQRLDDDADIFVAHARYDYIHTVLAVEPSIEDSFLYEASGVLKFTDEEELAEKYPTKELGNRAYCIS